MSVRMVHYVMLAIKAPYHRMNEDLDDDEWTPFEDHGYQSQITEHLGLTVISDGMGGKYSMIGKVIAKAVDANGEGLDMTECKMTPKAIRTVKILAKKHLGIIGTPKLYAFTHYS